MHEHTQEMSLNQNRLDDLIHTISEAKRSLNNWQDKRTEALIRLDSFTYDIQMLGEEKKRTNDIIADLKQENLAQVKVYQSHVSDLTDQMQLLKLENENLKNEVLDKQLTNESLLKEIESQHLIREHQAKLNVEKMNELRMDSEAKTENQINEFKAQNDFLNVKLTEMARLKAEVEMRAERLEREIVQIRSHMLNVLEVNQNGNWDPKSTEAKRSDLRHSGPEVKEVKEMSAAEMRNLRAVVDEPSTVVEYLKRLGY